METTAAREFEFIFNEIQINIASRLTSSAQVLYSGAALFYANKDVSRENWQIFTDKLRIEQQLPGTQGVGFSLLIPPKELKQHILKIKNEGFPNYTVKPDDVREIYSSIIYLEPFSGRNLRAFGYDMFSEPVRKLAMEQARDKNMAILSGKVILVQETNQDVQAGTLMYVPVYNPQMPISNIKERQAAIIGWVYSPYRMDDLMNGTLGRYELKQKDRHIFLQVYDGDIISQDALLYDSRSPQEKARNETSKDISRVARVDFAGRRWTLKFTQAGGLLSINDYNGVWLVAIGGTIISLLIFGLIISLFKTAHYLESIKLLAEIDILTGVFNRRKILALLENEFTRTKRYQHPLTILMIDIDSFKQINDRYGHTIGDQALCQIAKSIQETLRKNTDSIGRFGGDEFIIILPETSLNKVKKISARIQANVKLNTQNLTNGMDQVFISIGAAELNDTIQNSNDLIDQADKAMYTIKKKNNFTYTTTKNKIF